MISHITEILKTLKDYFIFNSIAMEEFDGRYGFVTFNAHIMEPEVFEDFLNFFLLTVKSFTQYAYHVEKEGTPDQHLHLFFKLPGKGCQKKDIEQKFNSKIWKDFQKSLTHKQTKWSVAFDPKLVANTFEDHLKTLGYCIKEESKVAGHFGFSGPLLKQAFDFYVSTARIKDSCSKKDIRIVNSRNFHILLEDFAEKNDCTVHDYDIVYKMTEARHSFQISDRDLKKYHSEVKVMNQYVGYDNLDDFATIMRYSNDGPCEFKELLEMGNQKNEALTDKLRRTEKALEKLSEKYQKVLQQLENKDNEIYKLKYNK